MTLIAYTYDIQPGTPEDITQVMANFNTVRTIVNGQLDNGNLAAAAGILASKLAGYPNDVSKSLRGDGSWQAAGGVADGYGTSLPGSPAGGDRFILVDNITNPFYSWYLRYNSGSSSSFKWEVIGGVPWIGKVTNDESTVSSTYVALGTVGPNFTVPRAGDYIVQIGFSRGSVNAGAVGIHARMSYDVGGTAANDADCAETSAYQDRSSVTQISRKNGLAASTALVAKYRSTAAMDSASFKDRWMTVMPARLS